MATSEQPSSQPSLQVTKATTWVACVFAHPIPAQINVQRPCHGLKPFLAAVAGGGEQFDFDAERLQHGKHLAKLAGWLSLFHFDDEPQSHGQFLLGHAQGFTGVSGQLANCFRIMLHDSTIMLPHGNNTAINPIIKRFIPVREQF